MTNIKDLKPQPPQNTDNMRPKDALAYLLAKKRNDIAQMLPKHLNVDRLFKVAIIAATTTPALAKCDIPSLVAAVGFCGQLGLEPNTPLGHAYLVPFNTRRKNPNTGEEHWVNSVQVIIGYRGYIELARRSGQIVSISAHEVCEKDKFIYAYGLRERLEHVPARGDRGPVIGFYAVALFKGGGHAMEYMSVEQIEEIRDRDSKGWEQSVRYKKEKESPWGKNFVEMGRKTAIRRIAKYLPLTIELTQAFAGDGQPIKPEPQLNDPNTIDGDFSWIPDVEGTDDGDAAAATGETAAPETGPRANTSGEAVEPDAMGEAPANDALPPELPHVDPDEPFSAPQAASPKEKAYERRKG